MKNSDSVTLKEALTELIETYRLKSKLHQSTIRSTWAEVMGPTISGYTKEIRLVGKQLHIHIESAPLRQELNYGKEKIRKIMNETLGEDFIQEVVVR
jgi:hypothetical protein